MRVSGAWGWVGLAAYVVAWDVVAPETLSDAFARSLRRPFPAVFASALVVGTVGHLYRWLPDRLDFYHYAWRVTRARRLARV